MAPMHSWPVQDAKARFGELLEATLSEGPQFVTKRGKATAVLVPVRQWVALQAAGERTLKNILLDTAAPMKIGVPTRGNLKRRRGHAESI